MSTRKSVLVGILAGVAIATIAGVAIATLSATNDRQIATRLEAPQTTVAVSPTSQHSPIVAVEQPHDRALEAENAEQAALISAVADYAIAVPFPRGVPDAHRGEVFRGVIESAVHECLAGAKLTDLSCEEPPCIAMIDVPESATPRAVFDCAGWQRVYGRSSGQGGFNSIDCQGSRRMVEIIAPDLESWDGWRQLDEETRAHIRARHGVRVTNMLANACPPRT